MIKIVTFVVRLTKIAQKFQNLKKNIKKTVYVTLTTFLNLPFLFFVDLVFLKVLKVNLAFFIF